MKKSLFVFLIGFVVMVTFNGCGENEKDENSLAHHSKNPNQSDFDSSLLNWKVDNGEGLKILVEDNYIYLQFNRSNESVSSKNIQFIIDVDNDTNTGSVVENGADYIVENGYLYKSLSRDLWSWTEVGKVESTVEGLVDTVKLDITELENINSIFRVNVEVLDDNWQPVLYSPSEADDRGNHKKTVYIP